MNHRRPESHRECELLTRSFHPPQHPPPLTERECDAYAAGRKAGEESAMGKLVAMAEQRNSFRRRMNTMRKGLVSHEPS